MFLYVLKSIQNNSYYIGITQNLENRLYKHNKGQVFSTKHSKPWIIIYKEYYETRSEAFRREKYLKSLKSREIIEKLFDKSLSN